ncbi:2Fe-2S iron-sulfur cluster-binding protein [Sphingomonas sp. PAMC 26621]|uniref:2Fe-2S iron-sulfur cluster-binding protein n=1 Tax=Sphingomonas sp. PAMC 26621 TaxID=1112213 RepID=UPI000289F07B|nr:2Fe-2S iron-sulfur cluster-binding protein [Sphingomonas sp. PAMC 26621]
MIRVRFVERDGGVREVVAEAGDSLLRVAQLADQPLEGTCEGQMACSTCHVILASADFDAVPPASAVEEDMLDLASGATRTSRLACQIVLTAAMDRITVAIPPESRNMQRG